MLATGAGVTPISLASAEDQLFEETMQYACQRVTLSQGRTKSDILFSLETNIFGAYNRHAALPLSRAASFNPLFTHRLKYLTSVSGGTV